MDDQKSKILVVDDEANNRKFLQHILKENYRISFAVNGKEALEVCRKVRPDLILLDIMMPEMDGFEACRHLKADVETANIPVIFVTAMNSIEDEAAGFAAGCVDYITKPISKAIVLARINTHLMILRQTKEIETAYDMMEQLVKERTRELENTQKELINKAVEAGRAQLSAIMLHNIGNAITPVSINIEKLKNRNIKNVSRYLLECYNELAGHKDDLSYYITSDPRGVKVAEFMKTLIQSLEEEDQKTDEMITTISAGVNYVSSILSLQRSYYAPEKNEMKENINLNELIDDALRIHEASIAKREIRVEKNFLSDIPLFPMEKNKLVQVLVNLVKNSCDAIDQYSAIKHGQQHWICFTTFFDGHKIGMSISDSGYGVEKERQNEIFEFGVSSKGSSGFGLYYCKNFLEANNGTLTLESEGKGKGAKVTLEILQGVNK